MPQSDLEVGEGRATADYLRQAIGELKGEIRAVANQVPSILAITQNLVDAVKKVETGLDRLRDDRVQSIDMRLARSEERIAQNERALAGPPELRTLATTDNDRIDRLQKVVYGATTAAALALLGVIIQLIFKGTL